MDSIIKANSNQLGLKTNEQKQPIKAGFVTANYLN